MRYALNKKKYLLDQEAEHLEIILSRYADTDVRNILLIEIALRTGARAKEILNIQRSDLNAFDETILIHGLKGSSDREIPIHGPLFKRLVKYASQSKSGLVFDVNYNLFRNIWVAYRPTEKKLHSLRHTFAIRLFKKTKDLRLVQLALGHRNITNTMVYADYVYSQTEMRKLIL